jgi:hypothetical protein
LVLIYFGYLCCLLCFVWIYFGCMCFLLEFSCFVSDVCVFYWMFVFLSGASLVIWGISCHLRHLLSSEASLVIWGFSCHLRHLLSSEVWTICMSQHGIYEIVSSDPVWGRGPFELYHRMENEMPMCFAWCSVFGYIGRVHTAPGKTHWHFVFHPVVEFKWASAPHRVWTHNLINSMLGHANCSDLRWQEMPQMTREASDDKGCLRWQEMPQMTRDASDDKRCPRQKHKHSIKNTDIRYKTRKFQQKTHTSKINSYKTQQTTQISKIN